MKFLKQILITFFTAIMTVVLVYGGYTIYAADEKIDFRKADNFYDVFDGYHGEMNEYFNSKIGKMVALVDTPGFYQNVEKKKQFLPPADLKDSDDVATIVKTCEKNDNFSSYCVGIGALKIYSEYLVRLNYLEGKVDLGSVPVGTSALELLRSQNSNVQGLRKESEEANAVMQATVAAYNEFRLAYPMHIKYQEILKQLTKYKLILKDVRLRVAEFPVRFVDASTNKCE